MGISLRVKHELLAALVITLTMAAPAAAQTKLGVLAGLSFSNIKTDPCICELLHNEVGDGPNFAGTVRKAGLNAGLTVERPLSQRVGLRVNALYSVVRFDVDAEFSDIMSAKSSGPVPAGGPYIPSYAIQQEVAMRRFEVDTLASIPVGRRASILAGLFSSFGMGQAEHQTTFYDDGYVDEYVPSADEKTSFSAFDMGLGLGAEFAPLHRVSVGAMLKLGLWNVGRDTGANSIKTSRFVVYTRIPIGKTR